MIDNSKEYILCAAIRRKFPNECKPYHEGTNDICNIEIGYRHHDIYQRFRYETQDECPLSFEMDDQGLAIAYNARQVDEYRALDKEWTKCDLFPEKEIKDTHKFNMLFSEDLY